MKAEALVIAVSSFVNPGRSHYVFVVDKCVSEVILRKPVWYTKAAVILSPLESRVTRGVSDPLLKFRSKLKLLLNWQLS